MTGSRRRRARVAWIAFAALVLCAAAAAILWLVLGDHVAVLVVGGLGALAALILVVLGVWWIVGRIFARLRSPQRRDQAAWRRRLRVGLQRSYAAGRGRYGAEGEPRRVILVVGPKGHGKTALIRSAFSGDELQPPSSPPTVSEPIACWSARATERGASGLFIEIACGQSPAESTALASMLVAARQERLPISTVLVCVSAEAVLGADQGLATLQETIATLRELAATLAVRIDVDLVVTKIDRVSGVHDLFVEFSTSERPPLLSLAARGGSFRDDAVAWGAWLRQRSFASLLSGRAEKTLLDDPPAREGRSALFTLAAQMDVLMDAACRLAEALATAREGSVRSIHFVSAQSNPDQEPPPNRVLDHLVPATSSQHPYGLLPETPSAGGHMLRTALADHAPLMPTRRALRGMRLRVRMLAAVACVTLLYAWVQVVGSARKNNDMLQALVDSADRASRSPQPLSSPTAFKPYHEYLQEIERLEGEPPHALRWGLYQGVEIAGETKEVFVSLVRAAVMRPVVARLVERINTFANSEKPSPEAANGAYRRLRTYLLLTEEKARLPNESSQLSEDLVRFAEEVGGEAVAREQLRAVMTAYLLWSGEDAWRESGDAGVIGSGRAALAKVERDTAVVASATDAVSKDVGEFTVRRITTKQVFIEENKPRIPGAFTLPGWDKTHEALVGAVNIWEPWVLGLKVEDWEKEQRQRARTLADLYAEQYAREWEKFFTSMEIGRFGDLQEALTVLTSLTRSGEEPLAELWRLLSTNTQGLGAQGSLGSVLRYRDLNAGQAASGLVASRFQTLVAFGIAAEGQTSDLAHYHDRLRTVIKALDAVMEDPTQTAQLKDAVKSAMDDTTDAIENSPTLNEQWKPRLKRLLLRPLRDLMALTVRGPACDIERDWKEKVLRPLAAATQKYPFVTRGGDLALDELTSLAAAIEAFRAEPLGPYLRDDGERFVRSANPPDNLRIEDATLALLNQIERIRRSAFVDGALKVEFSVMLGCNTKVSEVMLVVDETPLLSKCRETLETVTWPGEGAQGAMARFTGDRDIQDTLQRSGPWGFWRLLEESSAALVPKSGWLEASFLLKKHGKVTWKIWPTKSAEELILGDQLLAPFRDPVFTHTPRRLFAGVHCVDREAP